MRFKVLNGKHHADGKCYEAGELVVSDERLDKKFVNKFELCDAPSAAPKAVPAVGLVPTPVSGGVNVVNEKSGKPLNDKPVSTAVAGTLGTKANPAPTPTAPEKLAVVPSKTAALIDAVTTPKPLIKPKPALVRTPSRRRARAKSEQTTGVAAKPAI